MARRDKYQAAPGATFNKTRVGVYANVLRKLERTGPLTPERVVEVASDPHNPLHECFEWDSDKAAHRYRLWQARQLVSHILVEIVDITEPDEPVKMFQNVKVDDERQYVFVTKVMSKEELRQQVLDEIYQKIKYWQKIYKQHKELAAILENTAKSIQKLKKAA